MKVKHKVNFFSSSEEKIIITMNTEAKQITEYLTAWTANNDAAIATLFSNVRKEFDQVEKNRRVRESLMWDEITSFQNQLEEKDKWYMSWVQNVEKRVGPKINSTLDKTPSFLTRLWRSYKKAVLTVS